MEVVDRNELANARFHGRLGVIDVRLYQYRHAVYDGMAERCDDGLCLFSGYRDEADRERQAGKLRVARHELRPMIYLLPLPFLMVWQTKVIEWLEAWQPDAIVTQCQVRLMSLPRVVRWMRRHNRPIIGWGLGTLRLSKGLEGMRNVVRDSRIRQMDGIVGYGTAATEQYAAVRGTAENIFVAHNASCFAPTGPVPQRPSTFRDGRATVLYVGRIYDRKRLDLLITAAAALPDDLRPRLVFVGDGPGRAAAETLAGEIYPAELFEFRGALFGEDAHPAFREADLLVLPGLGGLALQEAMSHGLPVVSAEADGTQVDLVCPGNGWMMEPGSAKSLEGILRDALSDPARLRRMGAESYRIVQEEINIENMIARMIHAAETMRSRWAADSSVAP